VLAGVIRSVGGASIATREVEPLAELMSMGMASLVLWWMEERAAPRDVLVDAIARVWVGILEPGRLRSPPARP
jgi:hypothetical protein